MSLVLLSQMKRKSNMIVFIIQQDKLFMEYYMIHQLQYKTMKKAKINDPKYCDKSTNNRNMSASDSSIKKSSTWTNRISKMQNILNNNLLTVNASRKLNGKYLGILSTSLTRNYWILQMTTEQIYSRKYTGVTWMTCSSIQSFLLLKIVPRI